MRNRASPGGGGRALGGVLGTCFEGTYLEHPDPLRVFIYTTCISRNAL